jgi:hypothetical protein
MKANKRFSSAILSAAMTLALMMIVVALSSQSPAQTAAPAKKKSASAPRWSVQVDKVDAGDVELASAFQIAIYENLLHEFGKMKSFKQVFRSGDHDASSSPDLLILKTTVQKYSEGSEKKRAVTTVTGATKINVRSQLCTRDGKVVVEKVVEGDVHFFGSNLRATHNLARNVANQIKQSPLPEPSASTTGHSTTQQKNEVSSVVMLPRLQ